MWDLFSVPGPRCSVDLSLGNRSKLILIFWTIGSELGGTTHILYHYCQQSWCLKVIIFSSLLSWCWVQTLSANHTELKLLCFCNTSYSLVFLLPLSLFPSARLFVHHHWGSLSVIISESCNFHVEKLKYSKLGMNHPCCILDHTRWSYDINKAQSPGNRKYIFALKASSLDYLISKELCLNTDNLISLVFNHKHFLMKGVVMAVWQSQTSRCWHKFGYKFHIFQPICNKFTMVDHNPPPL